MKITYQTAESVCAGHPDKLCDYIADSILDACLRVDKNSRVACEVLASGHKIIVAGEITCPERVNVHKTVRTALGKVGYNPHHYHIFVYLHRQSEDISGGVTHSLEARGGDTADFAATGAGDQGTVYGYATNENAAGLPLPLLLSHDICRQVDAVRRKGTIQGIKPDGKAQVTVEYHDGQPARVQAIVVSVQHDAEKDLDTLKQEIIDEVLTPVFAGFPIDENTAILVNPSGRFVEGGPEADTGLTGRKLMVDTYGGLAVHGGGAFSGKDPTKVDRSGAYMARYIAKNVVAAGLAERCQVAISYAIGKANPVAVQIDTFGTGKLPDEAIQALVLENFDMRPAAIIEALKLRECSFEDFSAYGHFGNGNPTWERTDKVAELAGRSGLNG